MIELIGFLIVFLVGERFGYGRGYRKSKAEQFKEETK